MRSFLACEPAPAPAAPAKPPRVVSRGVVHHLVVHWFGEAGEGAAASSTSVQELDLLVQETLDRLESGFECAAETLGVAAVYVARMRLHAHLPALSVQHVLLSAVALASKFLNDRALTDRTMQAASGHVTEARLSFLEAEMAKVLDWRLFVHEWELDQLCQISDELLAAHFSALWPRAPVEPPHPTSSASGEAGFGFGLGEFGAGQEDSDAHVVGEDLGVGLGLSGGIWSNQLPTGGVHAHAWHGAMPTQAQPQFAHQYHDRNFQHQHQFQHQQHQHHHQQSVGAYPPPSLPHPLFPGHHFDYHQHQHQQHSSLPPPPQPQPQPQYGYYAPVQCPLPAPPLLHLSPTGWSSAPQPRPQQPVRHLQAHHFGCAQSEACLRSCSPAPLPPPLTAWDHRFALEDQDNDQDNDQDDNGGNGGLHDGNMRENISGANGSGGSAPYAVAWGFGGGGGSGGDLREEGLGDDGACLSSGNNECINRPGEDARPCVPRARKGADEWQSFIDPSNVDFATWPSAVFFQRT